MKIINNSGKTDKLYKKIVKTARKVLEQPKRLAFGLSFVDTKEIGELNLQARGKEGATDVLSFPTLEIKPGSIIKVSDYPLDYDRKLRALYLGDIIICKEVADSQAAASGHSIERETGFLMLHGLLHLLGYDHNTKQDEELMRECQRLILSKVGLKVQ